MKSIINQMLKDPILQIKELAATEGGDALHYFEQIFNLADQENERKLKKLNLLHAMSQSHRQRCK